MVVHNYEFTDDAIYSVEVYRCACCNEIIDDSAFDWLFCSQVCAMEFEELGIMADCG
jgi:hypothetical protein